MTIYTAAVTTIATPPFVIEAVINSLFDSPEITTTQDEHSRDVFTFSGVTPSVINLSQNIARIVRSLNENQKSIVGLSVTSMDDNDFNKINSIWMAGGQVYCSKGVVTPQVDSTLSVLDIFR